MQHLRALLLGILALGTGTAAGMAQTVPPARLSNFSVRAFSGDGAQVLIAGFVLNGQKPRPLLVRAIGPGLAPFGVTDYMIDPELRLFRTPTESLVNDEWNNDSDLLSAYGRLGAFALAEDSADAAALFNLAPGPYTAHAVGSDGSVGDVLLEVYDAAENAGAGAAIGNVSLRGELGAENPVLIGGFVISGDAPKQVLVRAVGPTLADFGVPGAVGNPRIRLYRGSEVLVENDNWGDVNDPASVEQAFALAGAFPLPEGSQDAAIVTTLPPGAYTAHVEDPAGGNGIVLTEIYDLEPPSPEDPPPPSSSDPNATFVALIPLTHEMVEGVTPGARVLLTRSGDVSSALRVDLAVSGTAAVADCSAVPTSVLFPAGSTTRSINIDAWADNNWEPPEILTLELTANAAYTITGAGRADLIIRDRTPANGTGWLAEYFNSITPAGTPAHTRTDSEINFEWSSGASPAPGIEENNYSVRWTGTLQAEATSDHTFTTRTDDGVRLWINEELLIDRWDDQSPRDWSTTVPLTAGVRYRVRMEYFNRWGRGVAQLSWQRADLPREVIPASQVTEPSSLPPAIISPTNAFGFVGGPFEYTIVATGEPQTFAVSPLPAGLSFDALTGTISGTPATGGYYTVVLSSSNPHGTTSELLDLVVLDAGPGPESETWNVAPSGMTAPDAPPDATTDLISLNSTSSAPASFERIRGYITAPVTGNYRFWTAGSGPVEFHLADSDQPADRTLRARLSAGTTAQNWFAEPAQRSTLIALEQGRRYYFELAHRPGGSARHLAVAWRRPGDTQDMPSEIIPGYTLSRFTDSAISQDGKSLYLASLRPEPGVLSPASGTVSLLFDEETLEGTVTLRFSGLSSPQTAVYIYAGEVGTTGPLIQALPNGQFDNFRWQLQDAGALTAQDIADALRDGLLYVVIHTTDFPTGELRGQFGASIGSARFTPPPAPPALSSDPPSPDAAARLLAQATFGATEAEITRVQQMGYDAWLTDQFNRSPTYHLPLIDQIGTALEEQGEHLNQNYRQEVWWQRVIKADDQLRQRVAFALSELFVVSENGGLKPYPAGLSVYYDILVRNAFGDFRTLLEEVTKSPSMGVYLSMLRNEKPDPSRGRYPDENYAREIMQLFTIGLHKLHPDGTLVLDANGLPIPTYDQDTIIGLAHVFTGWSFHSTDPDPSFRWGERDYRNPMMAYEAYHDREDKLLLESAVLEGGGTAEEEMTVVLDLLFAHPNVGPFISRQLIQRLVTSNPSPGYVYRVAQVFDDNGSGVRGDLRAVVRAILTDYEARAPEAIDAQGYGKLREPILRLSHLWRAFHAQTEDGYFPYHRPERGLGQASLRAPTVFNFFEPGYVHAGVLASAGLVAPEFQITNENWMVLQTNELRHAVFRGLGPSGNRVALNLTRAEQLAADPAALVDWLNLIMMSGSMSVEMRTEIIAALNDLNAEGSEEIIRSAINLISVSPEYVVQK